MAETTLPRNGTRPISLYQPRGTAGLRLQGGRLYEEYLRAWQSYNKRKTILEMQTDEMIGAALLAYRLPIVQTRWEVIPADKTPLAQEHAEYVRTVLMEDMAHSWEQALTSHTTMIPWGWVWSEVVYKWRRGHHNNPARSSLYNDGKLGIHKILHLAQDTHEEWIVDENNDVLGIKQEDHYSKRQPEPVPIETSLHMTLPGDKESPEGNSMLRWVYQAWYYKKEIKLSQAIRIDRDATGTPIYRAPTHIIEEATNPSGDPNVAAAYKAAEQMLERLKTDVRQGIMIPSARDHTGNYEFDLDSYQTAENRTEDTLAVIKDSNLGIMLGLLTGHLLVGHEQVGSMSLSDSATSFFAQSVAGIMEIIRTAYQRQVIRRLWHWQNLPAETMPDLQYQDIEVRSLVDMSQAVLNYANAGMEMTDIEMQQEVRRSHGWPPLSEEKIRELSDEEPEDDPSQTVIVPEVMDEVTEGDTGEQMPETVGDTAA